MAASPGPGVAQVVAPPDRVSLGHAVNALYTSHDPTTRSAADEWLQSFLRSDIAWPLSIQLLSNATDLTSLEALFCARALHVLLRKSVVKPRATQASHAVLVEDDWVNMRSALLALAWNFSVKGVLPNGGVNGGANGGANGGMNSANANCTNEAPPRTVLTQVSLAISVLACKMVSWSADGIVTDLITHFTGIGENGDRINAPTSAKEIVSRWMEGNTPNNPDQHLRLDTDQHAFGEHLLATAGEQCLISILAVLPESCHSKELSIHPARRAEVGEGLKKAATPIVFPTLDLLAAKAFEGSNGGGFHDTAPKEHHARASTLNACAAWSLFDETQNGSCPSLALSFAVKILTDTHQSHPAAVIDAAVTFATSALVGAVHREERRAALGEALTALRTKCGGGVVGTAAQDTNKFARSAEQRARCAEVLASVACRAAEPAPVTEKAAPDPFGVGKDAAGDRTYVPYKDFAKARKAKKRSDKREDRFAAASGAKPAPLVGCDLPVLCFCLDALAEAMRGDSPGGASPAAALEPWTSIGAEIESHKAKGGYVPPIARELIASAGLVARVASTVVQQWFPKDGQSTANDGNHGDGDGGGDGDSFADSGDCGDADGTEASTSREDLAEGLRDVASVVGADLFLGIASDAMAEALLVSENTENVEGCAFVLFATARLVTKAGCVNSQNAKRHTTQTVAAACLIIQTEPSPRAVELATWILGGLGKAIGGCDDAGVLLHAMDAVLCAMTSQVISIARGACVASMRLVETNACAFNAPEFGNTRARLLEAYRMGVVSPPLAELRRGQEPVSTILARSLACIAAAMEPAGDATLAVASLAAPAAASASSAAAATITACHTAGSAKDPVSLETAFTSALNHALSLYVCLVETKVVVQALMTASKRASAHCRESTTKYTSASPTENCVAQVLRGFVFPAAVAAVSAARQARPLFSHCGFGTDADDAFGSHRVRRKVFGSLAGSGDIVAAAADLTRIVVKSSAMARDGNGAADIFAPALHLAVQAFTVDQTYHHQMLWTVVDACHAGDTGDAKFHQASDAVHVVLRCAFAVDTTSSVCEKQRAAVFSVARAAIRAGCPCLAAGSENGGPSFFAEIAQHVVQALQQQSSGEHALYALQFASDVACAASMLAPESYAPGRTHAQAVAATSVHPGMGRLASAMSGSSHVGSELPGWRRSMVDGSLSSVPGNESVVAAAAAFALTTKQTHSETELPIGAQILKQMIACACGQMPPGLVTDISAALFVVWASCGDFLFGGWLTDALGGDKNGFPRRSTTIEQKRFFVCELLAIEDETVPAALRGVPVDETSGKMDLRRFKRVVKAFCGGKKVGK